VLCILFAFVLYGKLCLYIAHEREIISLVHMFGNGFDLNLRLKTSFSDFLPHYVNIDSSSNPVLAFKDSISKDIDLWSDLEIELGKYCSNINTVSQFDEIFEDISDELKDYLIDIENTAIKSMSLTKKQRELFKSDLLDPEQHFEPISSNSSTRSLDEISIISFNYTRTIELLFDLPSTVMHIHGSLKDEIIMGVDKPDQIMKENMRSDLDITEAMVKPVRNSVVNPNIVTSCEDVLSQASVVSIFGSSLGATDQYWWDMIGKYIEDNDLKVVIFCRSDKNSEDRSYKRHRFTRSLKSAFSGRNRNHITNRIDSNVVVVQDSEIFDVFRNSGG